MTKIKLPTRAEADAMFREYRAAPTIALRNRIAEAFIGTAYKVAHRAGDRLPSHLDRDELLASAMPGLLWSIERYDPSNAASFPTFAALRIRGSIFDAVRKTDHVPRQTRERNRRIKRVVDVFRTEHGREPAESELQERLGHDDETFAKVRKAGHIRRLTSLSDKAAKVDFNRDNTLAATIPARPTVEPGTRPDAEAIVREIVLPNYGLRNVILLRCYYAEQMTMRSTGEALGVSETRASQMHGKLIAALRGQLLAGEAA